MPKYYKTVIVPVCCLCCLSFHNPSFLQTTTMSFPHSLDSSTRQDRKQIKDFPWNLCTWACKQVCKRRLTRASVSGSLLFSLYSWMLLCVSICVPYLTVRLIDSVMGQIRSWWEPSVHIWHIHTGLHALLLEGLIITQSQDTWNSAHTVQWIND